jgi:UDP-glucose 4-epimerase
MPFCEWAPGGDGPISLYELAHLLVELSGQGSVELVPWPIERKKIDIGDVYSSYTKIEQALGWRPTTDLRTGLATTLAYYRQHWAQYAPEE